MRQKLKAENLLEWIALKANLVPRPVYDTGIVNIQSRCIVTAVKCGIFAALLQQPKTLDALAKECECDSSILSLVLQVLISCNYIVKRHDHYQIAKKMKKWLVKESATSVKNNILLVETQPSILGQLDQILKTGKTINMHSTFTEKRYWQVYQAAMLELAKQAVGTIKKKIPIKKNAKVLLDIGGSHGLLGAAICRANGIKKSMVLDLPQAIEFAKPLAKQEKIDDIVEFKAFNILEQPLNIPADVILMANLLHHFNEQDVLSILKKVYNSLSTDGTIVILDFTTNSHRNDDCILSAASLYFRLTSDSECYTIGDYQRFLKSSGFDNIKVTKLLVSPFSQLITARKPTLRFN